MELKYDPIRDTYNKTSTGIKLNPDFNLDALEKESDMELDNNLAELAMNSRSTQLFINKELVGLERKANFYSRLMDLTKNLPSKVRMKLLDFFVPRFTPYFHLQIILRRYLAPGKDNKALLDAAENSFKEFMNNHKV